MRAIATLAITVTVAPWTLSHDAHTIARAAGLTDDDILHVLALSAYFGHLNRIADAVAVPLDYPVELRPPPADPSVPAFAPAPQAVSGGPALAIASRAATATALAAWTSYVFERDAPLARTQRDAIARAVAHWLGDASSPPARDPLVTLAETVTLAPWQLTDASFAPLRALGMDDAAIFDACVTASTAGVQSRLDVALRALAT